MDSKTKKPPKFEKLTTQMEKLNLKKQRPSLGKTPGPKKAVELKYDLAAFNDVNKYNSLITIIGEKSILLCVS